MGDMHAAIHHTPADTGPRCDECHCAWHGLPCRAAHCLCQSAFVDKYATEETA